ncbi:hypothetical protein Lal_00022241 [Lupinus albus]|nr:hypothetical protein Lal_00022241 [Lupinus albus]
MKVRLEPFQDDADDGDEYTLCMTEKVGVAPIVEKMVESHLRWFGHVWRRPVEALVKRVDQMEASPVPRGRGKLRKLIGEMIKKDLQLNALSMNMIYDRTLWRRSIHVTSPPNEIDAWLLLLYNPLLMLTAQTSNIINCLDIEE